MSAAAVATLPRALTGTESAPCFLSVLTDLAAHIICLGGYEAPEELREPLQLVVVRITDPREYLYAIFGLTLKVISNIVHNEYFAEAASQTTQVLHIHAVVKLALWTVQSVREQLLAVVGLLLLVGHVHQGSAPLNHVQYEVGVVLRGSSEHDELEVPRHLFEEPEAARPQLKLLLGRDEVHQCLVQVEHKRVRLVATLRRQNRFLTNRRFFFFDISITLLASIMRRVDMLLVRDDNLGSRGQIQMLAFQIILVLGLFEYFTTVRDSLTALNGGAVAARDLFGGRAAR